MQTLEQMKEEYINAHRHDWTMHQEANWWLSKFHQRESSLCEQMEGIKRKSNTEGMYVHEKEDVEFFDSIYNKALSDCQKLLTTNKE